MEKADTPAMYAKAMDEQFRKWMDWFGKTYTDFTVCTVVIIVIDQNDHHFNNFTLILASILDV